MQIVINDKAVNLVANNGQVFASSLDISSVFEKPHDEVLRKIRTFSERGLRNFTESSYLNAQNKQQPMFEMNRDGFAFLAMGFTGKKAEDWKLDFIDAFNLMEVELKNPKQLTNEEKLQVIATETIGIKQEIAGVRHDVELLKQDITLNSREKHALKTAVGSKIASFNLKPENVKKIYAAVWKKVKDRFLVASYMEIPRLQFADALHFVQNISMEDLV